MLAAGVEAQSTHSAARLSESIRQDIDYLESRLAGFCEKLLADSMGNGEAIRRRGRQIGSKFTRLPDSTHRVDITRIGPADAPRQLLFELHKDDQPRVLLNVTPECKPAGGRAIEYGLVGVPAFLISFDSTYVVVDAPEPVDPEVGRAEARPLGRSGVRVGLLDSGVDYRQGWLAKRLARNVDGTAVGYDFEDDDSRPFDANPSRSVFFPGRHGTRVASIVLDEAAPAQLVPYRYPRSNPKRLADVVKQAIDDGVRILNMSLGSRDRAQWMQFAAQAQNAPILFVVSAGNDGSNLDERPLYPASFDFDNILVVTSANDNGSLARGSGYGSKSVDVMVAGERRITRKFGGGVRSSSGSSFAAARVSAFAACLLSEDATLDATALKQKILRHAKKVQNAAPAPVGAGYLDLDSIERGAQCHVARKPLTVDETSMHTVTLADTAFMKLQVDTEPLLLRPTVVRVARDYWPTDRVTEAIHNVAILLSQCNVLLQDWSLVEVQAPLAKQQIDRESMSQLARLLGNSTGPRIFLMDDTLQEIEYGAQAFGRVNARSRHELRDSVWITGWSPDTAHSLAHELVHVLADSGLHRRDSDNLMHEKTSQSGILLDTGQCGQIRNIGLGNALLSRLSE